MALTEQEIQLLKDISGRIRAEAVSILLVSARDRMLEAGVRRQVVIEVLRGITRDAEQQFERLDEETVRLAFEDLSEC